MEDEGANVEEEVATVEEGGSQCGTREVANVEGEGASVSVEEEGASVEEGRSQCGRV